MKNWTQVEAKDRSHLIFAKLYCHVRRDSSNCKELMVSTTMSYCPNADMVEKFVSQDSGQQSCVRE